MPEKKQMHERNKHRHGYNFDELIISYPDLKPYVFLNKYGNKTIEFANPIAVKQLNTALLHQNYSIDYWDIPEGYLCPPIPGRAEYIHHIADLLAKSNEGKIPKGKSVRCLDIGVGANLIYPIIGINEYGWSFVGSDIDEIAIKSAKNIAKNNRSLKNNLELRMQYRPKDIFRGIIKAGESFDAIICNPPFYTSAKEAFEATNRKLKNLGKHKSPQIIRNFGGQKNELWTEGGEKRFISDMIMQSRRFAKSCRWFTTLISKESNLKALQHLLKTTQASHFETIEMKLGNKTSRVLAWTYTEIA